MAGTAARVGSPIRPGWSAISAPPTPGSGWSRRAGRCCIRTPTPATISRRSTTRSGPISETRGDLPMPRIGALAIAAAITGDRIRMTNHPWSFSVAGAARPARLRAARRDQRFHRGRAGRPAPRRGGSAGRSAAARRVAGRTIAVLGPGSGLGASGLVPAGSEWVALSGEGGHATMAPASERESAVLDLMRARFDHVSAERLHFGARSRQSLQQPGGARRGAGGSLTRRRRSPIPRSARRTGCAARRPRCSARCSAPWPAIWR